MPHRVVRILLVDDDEEDAFITEELLGDAPGRFDLTWISSYESALRTAAERDFDVCLVDYRIGGETGIEFLEKATAQGVACPMIMLTGVGQHEIDVAASEVGAADFLDKGSLTPILLERAIRYAIANASALRELAEQQEVLATTMESLQGGIVAFDACGQVLASNQRFETLMEQIGSHNGPGRRLSPVDMARQLLETIDDRQRDNVVEMESSDGRAFEIRISPVPGRGNVFLIVDSTEQKTLQRRILEAKIAAEKSNTAKSAFLAKVSHELRTPLNGVFGMAQLLKMTTLDQKQEVHVNRLIESAMGLMALIEDLLDISLVEQGHFKLRNDEINIEEIVTDACTVASASATNRPLNITQEIEVDTSKTFYGDEKRIKQIITNFLSNAIKFTAEGNIEVTARQTIDGWVRFVVSDDGPGIAHADQVRIFERFSQVDTEISQANPGVGLGLSIAKEVVEQMSGRLGVVSTPGSGAEFWFELPLTRDINSTIKPLSNDTSTDKIEEVKKTFGSI